MSRANGRERDPVVEVIRDLDRAVVVVEDASGRRVPAFEGDRALDGGRLVGMLPPAPPSRLGDPGFVLQHGASLPYVVGAMAQGISSVPLVLAASRRRVLAFLGTAGLLLPHAEAAVRALARELEGSGLPWGVNLIHSPGDAALEEALVDRYLSLGVERVSASAFLRLTPALVRFAATGLRGRSDGGIHRARHVFAKVSRPEVAAQMLAPPPAAMLEALVASGRITPEEGALAARLPVASHLTVEADSAGHTDSRPLTVILPVIRRLRDRQVRARGLAEAARIGAAGGLGDPAGIAAAFGCGADYVLTGSINQASVEAGVSDGAKAMLAGAGLADVAHAPAADMFELGARVQVLKRGTLFSARAARLSALYRQYDAIEAIPDDVRRDLEREVFGQPLERVWRATREWLEARDPEEAARADGDGRARMAYVFRWYLGMSSRWAQAGEPARQADYQLWCGPAMGAFNAWVAGSWLEPLEARGVAVMAEALMLGAARISRAHTLRAFGVEVPAEAWSPAPERGPDPEGGA